ncbi:hypothetical protein CDAR_22571 [Caerostris darwini]|uniref:Uncharacterized protein n=1 Tax=Caerostris darwini TaxID=1538125 RepID=A0AAV4V808_9ARAC|nr:hypothetical protein CDAR_22571 [Caerostris darwini]
MLFIMPQPSLFRLENNVLFIMPPPILFRHLCNLPRGSLPSEPGKASRSFPLFFFFLPPPLPPLQDASSLSGERIEAESASGLFPLTRIRDSGHRNELRILSTDPHTPAAHRFLTGPGERNGPDLT